MRVTIIVDIGSNTILSQINQNYSYIWPIWSSTIIRLMIPCSTNIVNHIMISCYNNGCKYIKKILYIEDKINLTIITMKKTPVVMLYLLHLVPLYPFLHKHFPSDLHLSVPTPSQSHAIKNAWSIWWQPTNQCNYTYEVWHILINYNVYLYRNFVLSQHHIHKTRCLGNGRDQSTSLKQDIFRIRYLNDPDWY